MRLTDIAVKTPSLPTSQLKFLMAKGCICSFILTARSIGKRLIAMMVSKSLLNWHLPFCFALRSSYKPLSDEISVSQWYRPTSTEKAVKAEERGDFTFEAVARDWHKNVC